MTLRRLFPFLLLVLLAALFLSVPSASADSSHARIIRLSVVTGDVRFAAKTQGDPLTDSRAGWDAAQMNLPIRQGYVLATDNGRTEVEFENGTLAFHVNPLEGDYFSVTGGDFTVEVGSRAT